MTEKLFAWFFQGAIWALLIYSAIKWFRPKTTRELLGRPKTLFERLQPTVEAYGDAATDAERDELRADAVSTFETALDDLRVPPHDFCLELSVDELGLGVAHVRCISDDRTWTLLDFDHHLLADSLSAPKPD